MADLAELVQQVRDVVYGARPDLRPKKDTLDGAIDSATKEVKFATPAMWGREDRAEFLIDGEQVELAEDHPAAPGTATVFQRGANGTTAAGQSDGEVVLKNPQYSLKKIEDTINYGIDNDLWPEVWIRNHRTLTWVSGTEGYELAATDRAVELMYQYDINDDETFHEFPTGFYEVRKVASGVPTGATSGRLLRVFRVINSGATVHYVAKSKPSSSDVASLPSQMLEIVVLRAAASLLSQAPEERRQRQTGRKRRDEQATDYGLLMAEATRLRNRYNTDLKLELKEMRRYRRAPVGGVPWH